MIERFNVSESLSEITDFSELDCKIDTEKSVTQKVINGKLANTYIKLKTSPIIFASAPFTTAKIAYLSSLPLATTKPLADAVATSVLNGF